ncbi:MAG: acyltransferase [Alphaproteobacteria bacterium]|nr:acyltransferase [Alphaproteobacteria bacterium]
MTTTSSANAGASGFLPKLESVRGIAALCVAYSHCGIVLIFAGRATHSHAYDLAASAIRRPLGWFANGEAAVIVFFVLSGLVLSLTLDRAGEALSVRGFVDFMRRRALRIYPAHIAALLLFLPLAYFVIYRVPMLDPAGVQAEALGGHRWVDDTVYGHLNRRELARSALLLSNHYNPVTWTLLVELIGSVCLPFFAAWSRPGRWSIDAAVLAVLAAGAAVTAWHGRPDLATLYLPAFYLGCMARTHGRRLAAAFARRRGGVGAGILLFLLLMLGPWADRAPMDVLLAMVLGMSAAAFGLVSLVAWGESGAAARLLLHPWMRTAGRLSYSFYLWHDLVLYGFARLLFAAVPPQILADWNLTLLACTYALTVGISLAIAALSYRWVERPFIALGRRLGPQRGAGGMPLAAEVATAP